LKKKKPESKPDFIQSKHVYRVLTEGTMIVFLALSIYLLIALLTYDANDPGWSYVGPASQVNNMVGRSGAWFADVLLLVFGYPAYLFPILTGYRSWKVFRLNWAQDHGQGKAKNVSDTPSQNQWSWAMFSLHLSGFIMTMLAATTLATLYFTESQPNLPASAGGAMGLEMSKMLMPAFNITGSTLVLLAMFFTGLTIFTGLSWLKLMDQTGYYTIKISTWSYEALSGLYDKLKDRAEARKIKATVKNREDKFIKGQKKAQLKIAPKISKPAKASPQSERVYKEKQQKLFDMPVSGELPELALLDQNSEAGSGGYSEAALESLSRLLELKLLDFGIEAEVMAVQPGPVVTRFEIQPAPGIKASKITGLAQDLARSMAVISVRVVEVIAGKTVIGIEIPNEKREIICLSDVLSAPGYDNSRSTLTLALGKDIAGEPVMADLEKMPHLLIAGTTGSGKSVGVNAMLISMLYKATPKELRLIMIDPKMLELSVYDDIPHLLTPVVTDMKEAANALRWCVGEMERRYRLMAALGVRNVTGYNRKVAEAEKTGKPLTDPLWSGMNAEGLPEEAPLLVHLPFVVVVIDEFADMMMIVGKKVEELIARIAQKARAAGIHLLLATQRPSVDVITGLIKANIPSRIAFQVSSRIDSRTILDQGGAEQLLGHGDMLYLPPGSGMPVRIHGAFVSDDEVHRVCNDWRRRGKPDYLEVILDGTADIAGLPSEGGGGSDDPEQDALYDEAVQYVTESRRASISAVQRKLRIGYNRSARMIEAMELAGIVTEMQSNGSREVLAPPPVKV